VWRKLHLVHFLTFAFLLRIVQVDRRL
jgi:hypothetical protein